MPKDLTELTLDPILAGPIVRKVESNSCHFWLATSAPHKVSILINDSEDTLTSEQHTHTIKIGERLFLNFITLTTECELKADTTYGYHVSLSDKNGHDVPTNLDNLLYSDHDTLSFKRPVQISSLLHGSCRKAHYGYKNMENRPQVGDGLAQADELLKQTAPNDWPDLLILSGDQIYADDVAGPMLHAIRQAIELLGIDEESLPDRKDTLGENAYLYHREALLPQSELADDVRSQFFKGKRKPVFTTDTAHNHLISLAEVVCMYLLVWSPSLWKHISLEMPDTIENEEHKTRYQLEKRSIEEFNSQLHKVQRVLAHLPTAMMFDDHDVTDDWNLTAAWEVAAYEHPLSKRIIGNALLGYFLCQGWGNNPDAFDESVFQAAQEAIAQQGKNQDDYIDELLQFEQWHYEWPTTPKLVVLDTRTRRWRSEQDINRPSGLMDWEALTDLQQDIKNLDSVIMVSPAPVFGVKLIESIQRVFAWVGKPLMVDAENWMAHPGSAYALMNLFTHAKTPNNFVILSGDVHYSFAYDIKLRGQKSSPNIWQITSSGQRNEFPHSLLEWFDRLNRWLYAPWSPLNVFTKRRALRITPRKPDNADKGERLLNHSGMGFVKLNQEGQPTEISQLCNHANKVTFQKSSRQH